MSADEARFYLSLNSPELSEANFQLSEAKAFAKSLRQALERISSVISPTIAGHHIDVSNNSISQTIEERIKFFCEPTQFSSRSLAETIHRIICFLGDGNHNLQDVRTRENISGLYRLLLKYWSVFFIKSGKP